jgi:hypothetical protein
MRRSAEFDPYTAAKLDDCINILGQVSDEVAILLYKQMQVTGDFAISTNRNYDVQVDNIEERNKLNYNGFIYGNKIYVRHLGLKVLVLSDMKIYELQGGIDDTNWEEIK